MATVEDLNQKQVSSTLINCDIQAAIALAQNAGFHARTRHIEVTYHFIRRLIESKKVNVQYVTSESSLANLLTKGLSKDRHVSLHKQLGLSIVEN